MQTVLKLTGERNGGKTLNGSYISKTDRKRISGRKKPCAKKRQEAERGGMQLGSPGGTVKIATPDNGGGGGECWVRTRC